MTLNKYRDEQERIKNTLVSKINKAWWWHVVPQDPLAYKKRGKFLASTYDDAAFYGRPNIEPEKVRIENPIFGISENEILRQLFHSDMVDKLQAALGNEKRKDWYRRRISLDRKMFLMGRKLGYDAIILISLHGKLALLKNRKPSSIELNLLWP